MESAIEKEVRTNGLINGLRYFVYVDGIPVLTKGRMGNKIIVQSPNMYKYHEDGALLDYSDLQISRENFPDLDDEIFLKLVEIPEPCVEDCPIDHMMKEIVKDTCKNKFII